MTDTATDTLDVFYQDLAAKHMDALWRVRVPGTSGSEPRAPYPPAHWRWSDIRPFMTRAGALVEPGPDAERRVVQLLHPDLGAVHSASHTLTANVQMVLPGEVAPPHRHSIAAIRFIIEGEAAITIVDGQRVEMRPGDLVLTPAWHWHGHENPTNGPTLWMDTLDRPLTVALRQSRFEGLPPGTQPPPRADAPKTAYRYPWTETEPALAALERSGTIDAFDDVVRDYTNPLTGGHVLATFGCRMQLLRSGIRTRAHRHAYTSVYHVFRGNGSTIVDGKRIVWEQGDFFTVPPYAWHEHHNDGGAPVYLFSTIDAPVIDALGFAREDAYTEGGGHQPIVG
jgi:gentisate 1,2-dioxygenase